jgi:DNA-binding NtrC family response regulator
MSRPHLQGCSILIVEDEPLIVMDISMAFEHTGAHVTTTNTVKHAKVLVEHDGLSAAILDHALSDGECTNLCARLLERNIPFLMYSGAEKSTEGPCKERAPREAFDTRGLAGRDGRADSGPHPSTYRHV